MRESHCHIHAQDNTLPAFGKIKAEHVVPGIRELLSQLNSDIDALEANVVPTWSGLVEPIERIFDRLERAWGAVSHLKARLTLSRTHVMVGIGTGPGAPLCGNVWLSDRLLHARLNRRDSAASSHSGDRHKGAARR